MITTKTSSRKINMEHAILGRHLMGNMIKEEKKIEFVDDHVRQIEEELSLANVAERSSMETSNSKDGSSTSETNQLKSTKIEMGVVKEENERLKMVLAKILKDYESLQMHFLDIVDKEAAANNKSQDTKKSPPDHLTHLELDEEDDLVSLTLGRHSSDQPNKYEKKTRGSSEKSADEQDERFDEGPKLGLDCKFEPSRTKLATSTSPEVGAEKQKEDVIVTETWPPSKASKKTMRSEDHGEILQATPLKRARVSVRARCDTPTMNDGCQWRKYGQKIAKGNPCPRAYYRCTVSTTCPVRKQVQRCADDMSILTTTYEGTHNHPLPVSATAMASTTSAAASMLQSNSSSSQHGVSNSASLHGLSFTSSTLNSHPTITLDLTNANNSQYNYFNKQPRYQYQPSTSCLNFSTPTSTTTSLPLFYNKNGLNQFGRHLPPQENFYSYNGGGYMPKGQISHSQQQMMFAESAVAAATKTAITSNPMLRSALENAIATLVSNNGGGADGDANKSSHNMMWS